MKYNITQNNYPDLLNTHKKNQIKTIYGTVTSGSRWIFLQLEDQNVTLDLQEYSLFPVEKILSILTWIAKPTVSTNLSI